MERHREEVVNVYFAKALREAGLTASGEQIIFTSKERALPDVLVDYMGLRVIIEGKFSGAQGARDLVEKNASDRVRDGIAHIAFGIVYPEEIRGIEEEKLQAALSEAHFVICFCVETNYANPEWHDGKIDQVVHLLRRAYEILLQDETLQRAVEALRFGTKKLVTTLDSYPACTARIADIIGISLEAPKKEEDKEEDADDAPKA